MNKKIGYLIAFAIAVAAPFVGYPVFLSKLLCFALFACAFNLLIGFTGLLSFGHAAFFGMAGYVAGNAIKNWGWPMELGLLAGVAAGAAIGLVMGALAIRRQGIYFSMITLALAQMVYFGALRAGSSPAARMACRAFHVEIPRRGRPGQRHHAVLRRPGICVLAFALIVRTVHSPFGQVLKAIKENEPRAISLGYDVDKYKLLAFVLSAALAGWPAPARRWCWALKP
jgi:branched-chain amino acid transport system permease protein